MLKSRTPCTSEKISVLSCEISKLKMNTCGGARAPYCLYISLSACGFPAPVFVVQYLFDEAQITADNVGPPVKKKQWQYIHDLGQDMKQTLRNVS